MGIRAVDCNKEGEMPELVARTGRLLQRYFDGYRLIAGCIPFRYRSSLGDDASSDQIVEVLMISSTGGPGLVFPKGGWENDETVEQAAVREALEEAGVRGDLMASLGEYDFKSKTLQGKSCPQGLCKAEMFALHVKEELLTWPEQSARERTWLTVSEALDYCKHSWMREALETGFTKWIDNQLKTAHPLPTTTSSMLKGVTAKFLALQFVRA
ncbi:hypothetical protein V2J09_023996 [Rumex salicifolius]